MSEFQFKQRSHAELLKKLKSRSVISCFIDAVIDNCAELSPMKDKATIRGYLWERTKVNLKKLQVSNTKSNHDNFVGGSINAS